TTFPNTPLSCESRPPGRLSMFWSALDARIHLPSTRSTLIRGPRRLVSILGRRVDELTDPRRSCVPGLERPACCPRALRVGGRGDRAGGTAHDAAVGTRDRA